MWFIFYSYINLSATIDVKMGVVLCRERVGRQT